MFKRNDRRGTTFSEIPLPIRVQSRQRLLRNLAGLLLSVPYRQGSIQRASFRALHDEREQKLAETPPVARRHLDGNTTPERHQNLQDAQEMHNFVFISIFIT